MDLKKIFLKGACPTGIGGQAIMEGIMMRGPKRTAVAVRLPNDDIYMKVQPSPDAGVWSKIPIVRGVVSFVVSLAYGVKVLLYSADVLEQYYPDEYEKGKVDEWIERKLGKEKAWKLLMTFSVMLSIAFSVGVFMLLPTLIAGWVSDFVKSVFLKNLIEGVIRIFLFLFYILAISKISDIKRVFQYHGAEHKTIHCFENGLELTPENAQSFYTLHPRCGTSFLMFVMVIAVLLHSFMGWPSVLMRILSRLLVLPLIAGLSYELLKWAGRSDNIVVKVLSLPGIYLQKLTTNEPTIDQLEVAIAATKAVLPERDGEAYFEGICDLEGRLKPEVSAGSDDSEHSEDAEGVEGSEGSEGSEKEASGEAPQVSDAGEGSEIAEASELAEMSKEISAQTEEGNAGDDEKSSESENEDEVEDAKDAKDAKDA